MNVLHILFSKGWGGLERYAIEQASAMSKRGFNVSFSRRSGSDTAKALKALDFPGEEFDPIKYIDIRTILHIRKLVKEQNVEIVHAHQSADLGLIAPALWNMPKVRLIFYSNMQTPKPKKDLYHRMEYGRVDRVITLSEAMKKNAIENLPVAPEKVIAINYGLNVDKFDPDKTLKGALRQRFEIDETSPLIGVLGRLDPSKGQMEMIEAMAAILKKQPTATLIFIGDETPEMKGRYKPLLERRVKELDLAGNVIFAGLYDNPASALVDLDVYVMSSHSETFGMSTLEAMMMRRAIVGTDAGGTPELLDFGECGLLAEPRNPASFAENILRLLEDSSLREKFSSNARRKAVESFNRKRSMDMIEALYKNEI